MYRQVCILQRAQEGHCYRGSHAPHIISDILQWHPGQKFDNSSRQINYKMQLYIEIHLNVYPLESMFFKKSIKYISIN